MTGPGSPIDTQSYCQLLVRRLTLRTILAAVIFEPDGILRSSRCPVAITLTWVPPTSITRTLLTFWEAAVIASSRCDHRTRIAWRRAACLRNLLRLSRRTAGKARRSRPERETLRRWRR